MKRILKQSITIILILAVAMTSSAAAAFADSGPALQGETAIIYCATTDEVIWGDDADKEMNPASMTKLMTCLLAIENLKMTDEVEVTQEMTDVIPTKMWLQVGEIITVKDLLYAALLESANDAAMALAIATAGSIEAFSDMMNARAKALGCTHTNFVNPSGLYGKGHVSTARDIALISAEAFKNETLRKIAGTLEYSIKATNKYQQRDLENGNMLIVGGEKEMLDGSVIFVEKYDGVFGGKTGTTEEQVATMTAGLAYDGLELYVVVMGTTIGKRFSDMTKLLDYGRENVTPHLAFAKDFVFEEEGYLLGGATNKVHSMAAGDGYINLPEGASVSLVTTKIVYDENLTAPIEQGQKIGVAEIYLADDKVREIDVLAAEPVEEGWFLSMYGITNLQTILICAGLALLLLLVLTIAILRARNKKRKKLRRQQMIMERARAELEREQSMKQRGWPY